MQRSTATSENLAEKSSLVLRDSSASGPLRLELDRGQATGRGTRPLVGRSGGREEGRLTVRLPPELLRGLNQGRGVLFLGPGIPRQAGLRLRETLREAMANLLRLHIGLHEAEGLEAFLERASAAEIAQALQDQVGREQFLELLQPLLVHHEMPPPPLLYALRGLNCRRIITTNTDRLIERAFENPLEDTLDLTVVVPGAGDADPLAELNGRPTLLKLFGDLSRPEQLVLTSDDLESFWRQRPALAGRLKTLLEVGPALFVGYSLQDPEFRRLYTQVGALLARAHKRAYAIMDQVSRYELQWWQQRALTILSVNGQEGSEAMVREIYRQMSRQSHPGNDIEPDSVGTGRGGPATSWPLTSAMRGLIEQQLQFWLLPGAMGSFQLRSSYIPLDLTAEVGQENSRETQLEQLLASADRPSRASLQAPIPLDINTIMEEHNRVLLLGPAGAGKTTLLLNMLKTRGEAALEAGERFLVIYQPARSVATAPRLSLMECLLDQLRVASKEHLDDLDSALMDTLLDGRALVLLDGLDELPSDALPSVLDRLQELLRDCPRVKVVTSCRSGVWDPQLLPASSGFKTYELTPFTPEQSTLFIREQLNNDEREAEALGALLRVGGSPWIGRLAANPLHLLLICHRYATQGRFDDNRASLYSTYLAHVLRRSDPQTPNQLYTSDKELILQELALHNTLHPLESLSEEVVINLVDQVMTREHIAPMKDADRRVEPRAVVDEICRTGGILSGPGPRRSYAFRHNAIREYLTACRLLQAPERDSLLARHANDQYWSGVWRLMAAMETDATELLKGLEAHVAPESRLLQRCFSDARRVQPDWLRNRFQVDPAHRFGVLLSRLNDQLSHQEAIDLYGEILWADNDLYMRDGQRSDTRGLFVAISGLLRLIEEEGRTAHQAAETLAGWRGTGETSAEAPWPCALIEVPAGEFLMGDAQSLRQRYRYVDGFQIGRDALTVTQYLSFNPGHTLANEPHKTEFMGDLLPVVGVTWFDAWVCAQWYGCRLPTEAEWEKAAAWDPEKQVHRSWPWGDEWQSKRANSLEMWKELGSTTPIDHFTGIGESFFGCRDMAGNVFEWTSSIGQGLLQRRVLKGGSWQAAPHFLRAASAIWLRPTFSGTGIGFRLCRNLSTPH